MSDSEAANRERQPDPEVDPSEAVAEPDDADKNGNDDDAEDVFAPIYGHNDAKLVMRRALTREPEDGQPTHLLLVGPPGSGKSTFIETLETRVPGVMYRDAKNITPAKMRARLADDPAILLLDELDKLGRTEDYDVLSLPMESGRVQKDTQHESYDISIGTQIIATANGTDPIPGHILSRFREIQFDPYSREEYLDVCEHMLVTDGDIAWVTEADEARNVARMTLEVTGETDPRSARDVAKLADDLDDVKELSKAMSGEDEDIGEVSLAPGEIARTETEVAREELRERIRYEVREETTTSESMGNGHGHGRARAAAPEPDPEEMRDHVDSEIEAAMEQEINESDPNRDFE